SVNNNLSSSNLPTQEEYDALIELYNSTGGPNWTNNSGWSTANPNIIQDVSHWFGIATNAQGGVQFLSLPNNNLSGFLPDKLGDLVNLTDLNLRSNNIGGNIPSSIGNISNLGALLLDKNSFSGNLPDSISNLSMLQILGVSENELTGTLP